MITALDTYYTKQAIDERLKQLGFGSGLSAGPADPSDPPGANDKVFLNFNNGTIWTNDNNGHWRLFG